MKTGLIVLFLAPSLFFLSACKPSLEERNDAKLKESRSLVTASLKDPLSAQFRNEKVGKAVCGELNAKNSYGAYNGFKRYIALIPDKNKDNPAINPDEAYIEGIGFVGTNISSDTLLLQLDITNIILEKEIVSMKADKGQFSIETRKKMEVEILFDRKWGELCAVNPMQTSD